MQQTHMTATEKAFVQGRVAALHRMMPTPKSRWTAMGAGVHAQRTQQQAADDELRKKAGIVQTKSRYELKFDTLNTLNSLVHPAEGARDETRFSTLVHPTLPSAKARDGGVR